MCTPGTSVTARRDDPVGGAVHAHVHRPVARRNLFDRLGDERLRAPLGNLSRVPVIAAARAMNASASM